MLTVCIYVCMYVCMCVPLELLEQKDDKVESTTHPNDQERLVTKAEEAHVPLVDTEDLAQQMSNDISNRELYG